MYRYAYHLIRQYWHMILIFSVVLFLAEARAEGRWSILLVPQFFVYGFLIYCFHWTLLTGTPISVFKGHEPRATPPARFWLAYVGFTVLAVVLANIAALGLARLAPGEPWAFQAAVLLAIASAVGLPLALFGTMLPAAALSKSLSLGDIFVRARKTFLFILWRLIVGPGLVVALHVGLAIMAARAGLMPHPPTSLSEITPANAANGLVQIAVSLALLALTAAILSMAYMRAEDGGALPYLRTEPT